MKKLGIGKMRIVHTLYVYTDVLNQIVDLNNHLNQNDGVRPRFYLYAYDLLGKKPSTKLEDNIQIVLDVLSIKNNIATIDIAADMNDFSRYGITPEKIFEIFKKIEKKYNVFK